MPIKKKCKKKDANQRLDKFLANQLNLARHQIQKLIKDNQVLKNNLPLKSSYLVQENDVIEITLPETAPELTPENIALKIIYEDADLAIIDKPAGLVVHSAPGHNSGTLVNALLYHFKELSDLDKNRLGIVHRLDRFTEGLMLIAKNNQSHLNLKNQFQEHQIKKKYYAVVKGKIIKEELNIDAPIGRHPRDRKKFAVISDYKQKKRQAQTHIKVLSRKTNLSFVEIQPQTGRTHQIRVHLAYLGYPVLGDPIYSRTSSMKTGQLLQAFFLEFTHPTTGKKMTFEIPVSERLKNYL